MQIDRNVQIIGVLVALGIALYSMQRYRARAYRRIDLLTGLVFALALATISLYPPVLNIFRTLLTSQNRWTAAVFTAVIILYVLFFYLLNSVSSLNRTISELVRSLAMNEFRRAHEQARERKNPTLAIVIPAFNEERAIHNVLGRLPKELLGYRVEPLVIVDGGSDDTEIIARQEGYLVVSHAMNRGHPAALRTGFAVAVQRGADIVVSMDADGQHQAEDLERLVQPVSEGKADFVLGSRIRGVYEERGSVRHAGIIFFSWLLSLLLGQRITDCSNGFRAIRARDLPRLELREDRIAPELLIEARRKGLRILEVPVTVLRRAAGESKMPRHIKFPLSFLWTIIRVWLR